MQQTLHKQRLGKFVAVSSTRKIYVQTVFELLPCSQVARRQEVEPVFMAIRHLNHNEAADLQLVVQSEDLIEVVLHFGASFLCAIIEDVLHWAVPASKKVSMLCLPTTCGTSLLKTCLL